MNRIVTLLTIMSLSVLMAQCTAKKTATAVKSPEEIVADVKKNFTEQQMEEGKVVFNENCGKCHDIVKPEARTVAKWERVLPPMSKKAKLDEVQASKVRAYVLAHAQM